MFTCIDCPVFDPFDPESEAAVEVNKTINAVEVRGRDLVCGFCRFESPRTTVVGRLGTTPPGEDVPALAVWPVVHEFERCFDGACVLDGFAHDFRLYADGHNRAYLYRRILDGRANEDPGKDHTE